MTATVSAQLEALCNQAGLPDDEPLRLLIRSMATSIEDLRTIADRIGRDAAARAATAAVTECRAQMLRAAREMTWIRRLALAGLVVVAAGGGWWAGQRLPQPTSLGRLAPAQAEALRWNDLGALLEGCARQPPQAGREWCVFTQGWWLSSPPPPKAGRS